MHEVEKGRVPRRETKATFRRTTLLLSRVRYGSINHNGILIMSKRVVCKFADRDFDEIR